MASGSRLVRQEREESGVTESFIEHNELDRFIVNTHAFHNSHLLRSVLPRNLTAPISYSQTRVADHLAIANKLQESQCTKRAKTAEKRKATMEGKRKAEDEGDVEKEPKKRRKGAESLPVLTGESSRL